MEDGIVYRTTSLREHLEKAGAVRKAKQAAEQALPRVSPQGVLPLGVLPLGVLPLGVLPLGVEPDDDGLVYSSLDASTVQKHLAKAAADKASRDALEASRMAKALEAAERAKEVAARKALEAAKKAAKEERRQAKYQKRLARQNRRAIRVDYAKIVFDALQGRRSEILKPRERSEERDGVLYGGQVQAVENILKFVQNFQSPDQEEGGIVEMTPGSGKTPVILISALYAMSMGLKVLLVSPAGSAFKNLCEYLGVGVYRDKNEAYLKRAEFMSQLLGITVVEWSGFCATTIHHLQQKSDIGAAKHNKLLFTNIDFLHNFYKKRPDDAQDVEAMVDLVLCDEYHNLNWRVKTNQLEINSLKNMCKTASRGYIGFSGTVQCPDDMELLFSGAGRPQRQVIAHRIPIYGIDKSGERAEPKTKKEYTAIASNPAPEIQAFCMPTILADFIFYMEHCKFPDAKMLIFRDGSDDPELVVFCNAVRELARHENLVHPFTKQPLRILPFDQKLLEKAPGTPECEYDILVSTRAGRVALDVPAFVFGVDLSSKTTLGTTSQTTGRLRRYMLDEVKYPEFSRSTQIAHFYVPAAYKETISMLEIEWRDEDARHYHEVELPSIEQRNQERMARKKRKEEAREEREAKVAKEAALATGSAVNPIEIADDGEAKEAKEANDVRGPENVEMQGDVLQEDALQGNSMDIVEVVSALNDLSQRVQRVQKPRSTKRPKRKSVKVAKPSKKPKKAAVAEDGDQDHKEPEELEEEEEEEEEALDNKDDDQDYEPPVNAEEEDDSESTESDEEEEMDDDSDMDDEKTTAAKKCFEDDEDKPKQRSSLKKPGPLQRQHLEEIYKNPPTCPACESRLCPMNQIVAFIEDSRISDRTRSEGFSDCQLVWAGKNDKGTLVRCAKCIENKKKAAAKDFNQACSECKLPMILTEQTKDPSSHSQILDMPYHRRLAGYQLATLIPVKNSAHEVVAFMTPTKCRNCEKKVPLMTYPTTDYIKESETAVVDAIKGIQAAQGHVIQDIFHGKVPDMAALAKELLEEKRAILADTREEDVATIYVQPIESTRQIIEKKIQKELARDQDDDNNNFCGQTVAKFITSEWVEDRIQEYFEKDKSAKSMLAVKFGEMLQNDYPELQKMPIGRKYDDVSHVIRSRLQTIKRQNIRIAIDGANRMVIYRD